MASILARHSRRPCIAFLLVGFLWTLGSPALAEDPATDFKQVCHGCHTIGGGVLQGPDLKEVFLRRDREWLLRFIQDPTAMILATAGDDRRPATRTVLLKGLPKSAESPTRPAGGSDKTCG